MRRLAAGRGAGVEHALSGARFQQYGSELGSLILHRDFSDGKAGDLGDRQRIREADADVGILGLTRVDRRLFEFREIVGTGDSALIDAQRQRRSGVVGHQNPLPLLWPVGFQRCDHPVRVVVTGFW